MSPHKYYFHKNLGRNKCSYAGKNKNKPKFCKRKAVGRISGNYVCETHHRRLRSSF